MPDIWILAIALGAIFLRNDLAMGPARASCAAIGERCAGILGGAMNMVGNPASAAGNLVSGRRIAGPPWHGIKTWIA